MTFQQQAGLGNGAGGGPGEHHGPQGTEYTLQGVMRFLQIEWHNHERARNAWDIERAEMRAKIAKQEGENKQGKRINEQLERQVKMLEQALRNERAKSKGPNGVASATKGKTGETSARTDVKSKQGAEELKHGEDKAKPSYVPHNSFLDTAEQETSDKEREQYLDNTTKYLKNCMKEIQYLLTPPQHPPPQMLPNGNYSGLPEPPLIEDIYARQQPRSQRQQVLPQQQAMPIHQPPPIPNSLPQAPDGGQRDLRYAEYQNSHQQPTEVLQSSGQHVPAPYEEQVENVTHTYDNRGRPVLEQEQQQARPTRQQADTDGWTFDEETSMQSDNTLSDVPPARRPDTDLFPAATVNVSILPAKSPPRTAANPHRRKSSGAKSMERRKSSQGKNEGHDSITNAMNDDPTQFKVKFALRGHLDVVRSVIFSGGGSPSEPEVCTAGDDGTIKRWIVPATYQNFTPGNNSSDLDIPAYFTHRGHDGTVTSLAAPPASTGFSTGGRNNGEGWIFSGGQDHNICVWERGRVDPKAVIEGHTDAVWAVCVLPASVGVVFGPQSGNFGGPDRLLLVSGSSDGTVKIWAVSSPPQSTSPATGSRRGVGGSRRHSVTSGSNYPTSPQPSVASATPLSYTLVHSIERTGDDKVSPTSICPLSSSGENFVVSYADSTTLIYDTRTGEEVIGMASNETYDGTMHTSINAVVAASTAMEGNDTSRGMEAEDVGGGATGSREGIEGVVITGHEDRFIRFFDANSGQCTYNMVAHSGAISALSLSKDGREAVSAGHDASIRFWSLEKRICTQDIISHRAMRGEGVCDICWSSDGRLVVSAGGDGVVKVFAR